MKSFIEHNLLNPPRSTVYKVIFIAAIFSLLYLAAIAYRQLDRMRDSEALLRHSQIVRVELENLFSSLKDAESGQRGYIITGDSMFIRDLSLAESKINSTVLTLKQLVSDNPTQTKLLDTLQNASLRRMVILYSTMEKREHPYTTDDLKLSLSEGFMTMESIRSILREMIENENALFEKRKVNYESFLRLTPITYLLGVIFSLGVFVFSFYRILRERSMIHTANRNILLQSQIIQNAEQSSLTGTYALNEKKQPIYVSNNLLRLLGHDASLKQGEGNDFAHLLDPEDTIRTAKLRDDLWSHACTGSWDFKRSIRPGESKYFRESAEVIEREGQKILVGSIQDITNDKLAAQNFESAIQELTLQNTIYNHAETSVLIGNCIWNATTQKMTCSKNLERLLGLMDHERVEKPEDLLSFLDPATRDAAVRYFQQAIETRKAEPKIFSIQLKNGQVSYFRVSVAFVKIQEEEFIIGTFQEVTADVLLNERLRNTDDQLRKSEVRYQQMVSEVEDYSIILLNKDGIIESWNKGAEKIKGYTEDEIIGQPFSIFYTEEDRYRQVPQRLLETAKKEGRASLEGWRLRKDKTLFWGSTSITAIHDDNGEVIGFTKMTRDLTAQNLFEREQEKSRKAMIAKNAELEKMNNELYSFNHIVSHDLQEPLRKVQTFISLIADDPANHFTSNSSMYFDRIQNSTERMQILIHDLITYSQMRTDQALQTIDLNDTLQVVMTDLSIKIQENNTKISIGQLPIIMGIPFQLEQLFANLIDNAIKYARQEVRSEIQIQSESVYGDRLPFEVHMHAEKFYHITVQDNGIGFDNQYAESIFTLFQRLHGKSEYSGTGIGLAICKRIMENHNGFVTAEGIISQGAIFHLYFPAG